MSKEFSPSFEVLARFGGEFSENGLVKKTHLHFASRTSWVSSGRYLDWLIEKNYVKYKFDGTYQLTETGRELFRMILKLEEFIKSVKSF